MNKQRYKNLSGVKFCPLGNQAAADAGGLSPQPDVFKEMLCSFSADFFSPLALDMVQHTAGPG